MADAEVRFIIQQPLALAILNYLVTRPYGEVYRMVSGLQGLQVLPDPDAMAIETKGEGD